MTDRPTIAQILDDSRADRLSDDDIRALDAFRPCCWRCAPDHGGMLLCPTCGNKRCPHASDHDLACTGSNEPGQPGSVYGASIDASRLTAAGSAYAQTAEAYIMEASARAWAYLQTGAMTIPPPGPPSRPDVLSGEAHGGGDCDGMPWGRMAQ